MHMYMLCNRNNHMPAIYKRISKILYTQMKFCSYHVIVHLLYLQISQLIFGPILFQWFEPLTLRQLPT